MKDAKQNHDALESVYKPYVDFDGVRALAVAVRSHTQDGKTEKRVQAVA